MLSPDGSRGPLTLRIWNDYSHTFSNTFYAGFSYGSGTSDGRPVLQAEVRRFSQQSRGYAFPAVRAAFEAFRALSVRVDAIDRTAEVVVIHLHPTIYEAEWHGDESSGVLQALAADHAVTEWGRATRAGIEACIVAP